MSYLSTIEKIINTLDITASKLFGDQKAESSKLRQDLELEGFAREKLDVQGTSDYDWEVLVPESVETSVSP